jgi:hypothetical protein
MPIAARQLCASRHRNQADLSGLDRMNVKARRWRECPARRALSAWAKEQGRRDSNPRPTVLETNGAPYEQAEVAAAEWT